MKPDKPTPTVLLVGSAWQAADTDPALPAVPGCRLVVCDPALKGTEPPVGCPELILVDGDQPAALEWVPRLRELCPASQLIVAAAESSLDGLMRSLESLADDFLTKPISPLAWELALHRARRRTGAAVAPDAPIPAPPASPLSMEEQLETERLLITRQLLEKTGILIARLARDVQGGARYFNELPAFTAVHNRHGRVLAANPVYVEVLGRKVGSRSWDIYGGECGSWEHCPVGRTIRSGSVMTLPATVCYASGAQVPVIVHTAPIYSNEGEIELVLEVFAGTKEIESLAAEIKTTQQRFEQLFDAVPSYVAVLDRSFRITAANRRFRDEFGEHVGQRFFDVLTTDEAAVEGSPLARTLEDGEPHQDEMSLTAAGGKHYNLIAWTAPILTTAGKLVQILTILVDITELRSLQDNLSTLGMMMGVVSHSLKGSLTGLDAAWYLIENGFYREQPAKIEEGLDVGKLVTHRIRTLVRDILYYAKDRPLEIEAVNAGRFVEDLLAGGIFRRIRGADVALHIDVPAQAGLFEVDGPRLRTALVNILENALDACLEDSAPHPHEILFRVRAERNYLLFEIADNGIGMSAEQLQRMFTPFYSTKGRRGTGLGMFIASQVVQKHGGQLKVSSEVGRGTRFELFIPRSVAGVAR
jgi:PAS domain S-box-containing protein